MKYVYCASVLALAALASSGCAGSVNEQRIEAFDRLEQRVNGYFKVADGKLTLAHMQACVDARRGKAEKVAVHGQPQFTPNRFLACVANTSGGLLGSLGRGVDSFFVAYEATVPVRMLSSAGQNGQLSFSAPCMFLVDGGKIEFYDHAAEGSIFPSKISRNNSCFYMPGADKYVKHY